MPGLIIPLSADGIAGAIKLKGLFLLIRIIWIPVSLIITLPICLFLSMYSFPFVLVHNIRNDYKDAIVGNK